MHRNKQRKGISTIIAALFTVAVLVVGLNVMIYVSSLQNNFGQTEAQKNQKATERISEQLQLTGITVKNNQFNITLYNTGSLPVHLVKMWVTNNTATNWHQSWDLTSNNYILNPRNATRNIGQSLTPTLYANTGKTYTFGFVTERGTIATYKLAGGNDAILNTRIFASPTSVTSGGNVDIMLSVQHNNTLSDAVVNIAPTINPPTCSSGASASVVVPLTPTSEPSILQRSTELFHTSYTVSGNLGLTCTFTASVPNTGSNSPQVTVTLSQIKLTSTDYASNSGILTINYTSFRWTELSPWNAWNAGWVVPSGNKIAFRINMTNNNATGTLWLAKSTVFYLNGISGNNKVPFYIVNYSIPCSGDPQIRYLPCGTGTTGTYTCTAAPSNDYCVKVDPKGTVVNGVKTDTTILYFAATVVGGPTVQNIGTPDELYGTLLVFGKFASCKSCSGTPYGQNLPFVAVQACTNGNC